MKPVTAIVWMKMVVSNCQEGKLERKYLPFVQCRQARLSMWFACVSSVAVIHGADLMVRRGQVASILRTYDKTDIYDSRLM